VAPHGRGTTLYTGCRWSTRIQIGLSVNHTPKYLRGRGPNDRFRKNVPVTNSAGEKRIKVIMFKLKIKYNIGDLVAEV